MKYFLLILLLLTGCTDQKLCETIKGMHIELFHKDDVSCNAHGFVNNDPVVVCKEKCNGYLNTNMRIGNTTNIYSCSCDNK